MLPDDPLLQQMTPEGIAQSERLQRARADVRRPLDGWRPDPDTLAEAPILTDWTLIEQGAAFLMGRLRGHPHIGAGHRGVTSILVAVDKNWFWVRTISRFYRLGAAGPGGRRMDGP